MVALLEDREGTVWAAGEGVPTGRLCAMRSSGAQCYGKDGSLGTFVETLYEEPEGGLWVEGRAGSGDGNPIPPNSMQLRTRW